MGVLSDNNFMRLIPSVIYRGSVFYLCDGEFIQCDLDGMDTPIEYKPYFNGWMPYVRYSDKALSMAFSQEEIGKIYKRLSDMAFDLLPTVCRNLVKELPYSLKSYLAKATPDALVEETLADGEVQTDYTKKKVSFTAPTDFWELIVIRLKVWSKPVTEYILIDGPEYSKQNNPFTRAGKQNPVVAISNTS